MAPHANLTGQRFGRLVVTSPAPRPAGAVKRRWWSAICDCGNTWAGPTGALVSGGTTSCGCGAAGGLAARSDRTGQRFGRLVVTGRAERPAGAAPKKWWAALCDCGNTWAGATGQLTGGHTTSCGCGKGAGGIAKRIDRKGIRYGRLVVTGPAPRPDGQSQLWWHAVCDCGNAWTGPGGGLSFGDTQSCGCLARERQQANADAARIDMTGQRYGRLVITGPADNPCDGNTKTWWSAICDCGSTWTGSGHSMRRGSTKSCGCGQAEGARERGERGAALRIQWAETYGYESMEAYQVRALRMELNGMDGHTRQEVWDRDRGTCHICGEACDPLDWHEDHVWPVALGGPDTLANCAVAHPGCNQSKSAYVEMPDHLILCKAHVLYHFVDAEAGCPSTWPQAALWLDTSADHQDWQGWTELVGAAPVRVPAPRKAKP